jgi:GntR family galactonate operon transcriptional repressor
VAAYIGRGLHGQTVEVIARRIVSGELPVGATIDVQALGVELDLSITSLREALKVLTAKGLVDARQKRGTFVRPRAAWNLLDGDVIRWHLADVEGSRLLSEMTEIRSIFEPAVARLAAERRTDEDLAELQDALDEMSRAGRDTAAAVNADLRFHRALLSATHNELLARMDVVFHTVLEERDRLVHWASPATDPVPSHEAVVSAVRAGRAAAAERAMGALLDKAREDLERVLNRR